LRFVLAFQTVAPLTIGELWAWPSMLKLALLENLRVLTERILVGRDERRQADAALAALEAGRPPKPLPEPLPSAFVAQLRHRMREHDPRVSSLGVRVEEALAARGATPEDLVRAENQQQATDQSSTGNTVTSLRLCATLDWSRYVEKVSLMEQILMRDVVVGAELLDHARLGTTAPTRRTSAENRTKSLDLRSSTSSGDQRRSASPITPFRLIVAALLH